MFSSDCVHGTKPFVRNLQLCWIDLDWQYLCMLNMV